MRTILSLLCFSLIPTTAALAQPPAASLPDPVAACAGVGMVPNDVRSDTPVLAARLSMASCGAEARLQALTITDDDAGITVVQTAIEPSLATFDDVGTNADPAWQILAAQARADLLFATATRLRAAIPPVRADATGDELVREESDRAARRAALEPRIQPWLQEATTADQRVLALARAYPDVTQDLAVAAAVRRAQEELAAQGR